MITAGRYFPSLSGLRLTWQTMTYLVHGRRSTGISVSESGGLEEFAAFSLTGRISRISVNLNLSIFWSYVT